MRDRYGRPVLSLAALLGLLMLILSVQPAAAQQARILAGDSIAPAEALTVPLLAAGRNVTLAGDYEGGLIAGAFVTLRGSSHGDVTAVAGSITVDGRIEGNADFVAERVELTPQARITGNVRFLARRIVIGGQIDGNVLALTQDSRVDGRIAGDVSITTESGQLGRLARIDGDVDLVSEQPMLVDRQAQVGGETRIASTEQGFGIHGWALLWSMLWVGSVALALNFIWPAGFRRAGATLAERPVASIVVAIVAYAIFAIVGLICTVTIVGIPIAIVVALAAAVLGMFGWAVAMLAAALLMTRLLRQPPRIAIVAPLFLVSLVVFHLLEQVPVLGGLVLWLYWLAGVGALLLAGSGIGAQTLVVLQKQEDPQGTVIYR